MLELIRLEWKKNHIRKDIINAAIITGILLLLFFTMMCEISRKNNVELNQKSMLCIGIELFTHISYIVYASTMLSSYIVCGYKNSTISLMFSYPIKRKKIILAQMLSVWIFNVTALILTKFLVYGMVILTGRFHKIDMKGFDNFTFYFQIIISSVLMISICFIALFIGIEMKSSKAVLVTSIILVCLTQGNIGICTFVYTWAFNVILFILSLVSILLSIHKIETDDI